MKRLILLLQMILFILVSCSSRSKSELPNTDLSIAQEKNTTFQDRDSLKNVLLFDTLSLKQFWSSFQLAIKRKDKEMLSKCINFPIHAIHLVTLQYAFDCDTLEYQKKEEEFGNFDIDSSTFNQYYNFVFPDFFETMILKTSADDLLKNGIFHKNQKGLTYDFFPKDYYKIKCPNDHVLMLHINSNNNKSWKLTFGGL